MIFSLIHVVLSSAYPGESLADCASNSQFICSAACEFAHFIINGHRSYVYIDGASFAENLDPVKTASQVWQS